MISDSHTRYGSARSPAGGRHGSLRRWRSYQASDSAGRSAAASSISGEMDLFRLTAAPDRVMPPYNVIPGWCLSTRPGISRFSDVQLHIVVRVFDAPRNDCRMETHVEIVDYHG